MNKLTLITLLVTFLLAAQVEGQPSGKRSLFGSKPKKEKVFKNPEKVKKKAEAKEKKSKKDYAKFIKKSRKRSYEIQSPEVKARMKQNEKNTKAHYRSVGKKQSGGSRKARKKYN
jgi:hypothetical protein